jgi:hypothetical protein
MHGLEEQLETTYLAGDGEKPGRKTNLLKKCSSTSALSMFSTPLPGGIMPNQGPVPPQTETTDWLNLDNNSSSRTHNLRLYNTSNMQHKPMNPMPNPTSSANQPFRKLSSSKSMSSLKPELSTLNTAAPAGWSRANSAATSWDSPPRKPSTFRTGANWEKQAQQDAQGTPYNQWDASRDQNTMRTLQRLPSNIGREQLKPASIPQPMSWSSQKGGMGQSSGPEAWNGMQAQSINPSWNMKADSAQLRNEMAFSDQNSRYSMPRKTEEHMRDPWKQTSDSIGTMHNYSSNPGYLTQGRMNMGDQRSQKVTEPPNVLTASYLKDGQQNAWADYPEMQQPMPTSSGWDTQPVRNPSLNADQALFEQAARMQQRQLQQSMAWPVSAAEANKVQQIPQQIQMDQRRNQLLLDRSSTLQKQPSTQDFGAQRQLLSNPVLQLMASSSSSRNMNDLNNMMPAKSNDAKPVHAWELANNESEKISTDRIWAPPNNQTGWRSGAFV